MGEHDEYEFGASKHVWNDWDLLAAAVDTHYRIIYTSNSFWKYREGWKNGIADLARFDKECLEHWKDLLEGTFMRNEAPFDFIVRPYSDRMSKSRDVPIDLQKISEEDFPIDYKERGLKFNVVRELDKMAKDCDASVKLAIYNNGPIEWKKYWEACSKAAVLIYGPDVNSYLFKYSVIN